MNILEEIIAHKKKEIAERKSLFPTKLLEQSIYFAGTPVSLKKYILREDKSGIIAEFKRKSPSKGIINSNAAVEKVSIGYMQAGASALSILTDTQYFGGRSEDLTVARKFNFCPILRKDFIIDEYQIIEAKSIGADVILLIAAVLEEPEVERLAKFARSLGLEVLLEVHNEQELSAINPYVDLVGVNNRDLTTFKVDLATSVALSELIPGDFVKVSESGIHTPEDIVELKKHGFNGFLIGERFMQNSRPEKACAGFIERLSEIEERDYAKA
ncbi:Indole-3-glycerol phosphate synthase [Fulvivirga imtechensis AK7]|uniref:Indole-3-glycerol phosphate synthase n=1 Tax=Fulvivirga imtechensis AK7 TaxID=1237149 RepID=L8JU97_9BACT|nr:indole-3-glycerol phosphate synthase TrpC [Fulvivirga imtechensis]ELR70867.1 Indole-3-glycerol phosphate synthase [Fulvivirga imtechensis AK7]